MTFDWQTVRAVLLIAKPDWKPQSGSVETDDSRAYAFCEKVMAAFEEHLKVACNGCRQKKHPYAFFRCWDCEAYLCRDCIKGHGVSNRPHPKTVQQYEAEIEKLKAENFALAAGVCEYRSGDEHGNPFCLMTKTPIV